MLKIYNTLTRQKEQFMPLEPGKVRITVGRDAWSVDVDPAVLEVKVVQDEKPEQKIIT